MKITHSLVMVAIAILEMDRENDGQVWGYALSKRSGVRSGVLYPQLDRLMNEGWLDDHWEERVEGQKRPPRRYYTLTEQGRSNLGALARKASTEQRFKGIGVAFA